jgi:hypothetical protein
MLDMQRHLRVDGYFHGYYVIVPYTNYRPRLSLIILGGILGPKLYELAVASFIS